MPELSDGIGEAFRMLLNRDGEVWGIVGLSLQVSLTAVLLSCLIAVPLGTALGMARFPLRGLLTTVLYTFMAMPPVVVGLVVYLTLSRSGPFGEYHLLLTPAAMIVAQFVLVAPIVTGLVMLATEAKYRDLREHLTSWGANRRQRLVTVVVEVRTGILVACIGGLGRALSEVGAVMMVGGNIRGYTRVMTTAIALETRQGNFGRGIALGVVLLLLAFLLIGSAQVLQRGMSRNERTRDLRAEVA